MPRFVNPLLSQLFLQAEFAPDNKKREQVDACERLIQLIKPGHVYPYEFICYHITGYRSKSSQVITETQNISYEDLLHDIPLYAVQLSRSLREPLSGITGKIHTINSLTKHWRVSRKTISRWRQQGLVGRYVLFPDGRLRLGFSEQMVDFYVNANRKKVLRSGRFRHITPNERRAMQERLAKWAQRCPNQRQQAILRTARKFKRSRETIRSLLAELEQEQPEIYSFVKRQYLIPDNQRREIVQLYQQGGGIDEIARKFGRSKSDIYWAINREMAAQLIEEHIFYMYSPEFDSPNAEVTILNPAEDIFPEAQRQKPAKTIKKREILGHSEPIKIYIKDIYENELLTARQEFFLFRRYNYLKYRAAKLQKQIDPTYPSARIINRMRACLRQSNEDRHKLIMSNLRLVLSVARRHTRNEMEMPELISEGNMALMNAVEKFDFTRGTKLSTYATWAIVKRFATLRNKQNKVPQQSTDEAILEVVHDLRVKDNRVREIESARKSLEEVITENLETREQAVVREHFGLTDKTEISGQRKPRSLRQIAELMGLSKERVRQIELYALQKLRRVLTQEQFELLAQ